MKLKLTIEVEHVVEEPPVANYDDLVDYYMDHWCIGNMLERYRADLEEGGGCSVCNHAIVTRVEKVEE